MGRGGRWGRSEEKKKNANVNTLCSLNEINVKWYVKKKKKWEYLWRFFFCLDKGATGRRGNAKPQSEEGKRAMRACLKRAHVEVRPPNHSNKKVASVFASTSLFRFIKWHPALAQSLVHTSPPGLLRGTDMHSNKKAYVSLRVYTAQMRLWRCGMHVSLNWLKSIGNRKRCAGYYTVARSGTAEMLACLPPHVMASHEHTYIWSPTAASSETDKGQSSLTFHFLFCRKKKKRQAETPAVRGGFPFSPQFIAIVFRFSRIWHLWGWFYSRTAGYSDQIL